MAKPLPKSGGHTRGEKRKVVLANEPVQPSIRSIHPRGWEGVIQEGNNPTIQSNPRVGRRGAIQRRQQPRPREGGRKQPKGGTRKPSKLILGVGTIHRRKKGLQSQVNLHSKRMDRMVKPSSIQKGWTGWLNQAGF